MRNILFAPLAILVTACSPTTNDGSQQASDNRATAIRESTEPPLKCEIRRGAWCFMKSPYRVTFSHAQNEPYYVWIVSEDMWRNEEGVILEDEACAESPADTIDVKDSLTQVVWEGKNWRQVTLVLRKDSTCNLRLLAPMKDEAPLDMAASALSTHISACYANTKDCTKDLVADRVYPWFARDISSAKPARR